ncbi:MAG: restriction endonuclease subunit S, partial [Candidatus Coatesbacteria bacterium]|nr:restriction endonuclease subunit S [Candidatus Coatesbacteria bacterium]
MSETMRLLTSPLEEIPITWKAKTIGELAAPQDNAIVDGPFGSNLKVSDYVETGVPVLQGSNITGDTFELRDLRFVSPAKARELNRSLVRVGDLLVVKIGSVGYSAIIDDLDPYDEALIPANLLKATFDQAQVATKYVHHYLTSDIGRTRLIDIASQTAQPALTLGRFKSLIIPVPSLPEQRRIAEILDTADETIRHTERVIAKLRQVKAGL